MQQIIEQVVEYISGIRRFRWYAVATAWTLALVGWLVVFQIPNSYESRATVFIDTESVLKPLLTGLAVGSDVLTRANLVSSLIRSRPNLEKVARAADMHPEDGTPQAAATFLDGLSKRIEVRPTGNSTFTISYQDPSARRAYLLVTTLLNTFLEDTLGIKRQDTIGAQNFLQTQIKEYETKLRETEARLADFKKTNVGLMPGQAGDYYTRMQTAITNLETLRAQARVAQEKHNELSRQIDGEEPSFGLGGPGSAAPTSVDGSIASYQRQLEALLLKFTDKHPQVIALRETIAQLEAQRDAEATKKSASLASRGASSGSGTLTMNPVYQSMKIELSKADVELAELHAQISDQERTLADLRHKVNTIPEVESELTRLNRDYELNKAQYAQLRQRLESAYLGQEAEDSSDNVKIRIVEAPAIAMLPVWPNRPLLLAAVLLIALAGGVAVALLLHLGKPVFYSRAALQHAIGLPVLVSVTKFHAYGAALRKWHERPAALLASLGGLFVAYWVVLWLSRSVSVTS